MLVRTDLHALRVVTTRRKQGASTRNKDNRPRHTLQFAAPTHLTRPNIFLIYAANFLIYAVNFLIYAANFVIYAVNFLIYAVNFLIYPVNFLIYDNFFPIYAVNFLIYPANFLIYDNFVAILVESRAIALFQLGAGSSWKKQVVHLFTSRQLCCLAW